MVDLMQVSEILSCNKSVVLCFLCLLRPLSQVDTSKQCSVQ